ncbi:uncharacterized protein LOC123864739 [Maniola jurtina]|uniref:uncharacterized protein LOC123864739 n=1 Tax=Maniola jurtina TaxID=191418 RepID=UPI001E68BA99|nr:uncharacterized protein LOC123864739 [Maniola jurtina]
MSSFYRLESKLQRSKSMGALNDLDTNCADSKIVNCFANYSDNCNDRNGSSSGLEKLLDSLNNSHRQILDLKQKNRVLKGMVKQQQSILKLIKEDTKISYRRIITNFLEESMKRLDELEHNVEGKDHCENKQARSLLAAIEGKHSQADVVLRDARTQFENELRESFGEQIRKRLMADLEKRIEKTMLLESTSVRPPDFAWESSKHKPHLDLDIFDPPRNWWELREKLDFEHLKREDFFRGTLGPSKLNPLSLETEYLYAEEQNLPPSPPQPTDPGISVVDHLMQSALINKKISEGDLNGSFEEALSHCNLALVMTACRAVDPAEVFSPCCLTQSVLLSLVQQLATDMVHDTQLKCRYLEEALINLDVSDQVTRVHLPLVVREVHEHLSKFVRDYPHHVANRRVSLIIMAAENLIK